MSLVGHGLPRTPYGQPFERADLVSAHEAAVALDICCEDGDKASADFRRVRHACPQLHLWWKACQKITFFQALNVDRAA